MTSNLPQSGRLASTPPRNSLAHSHLGLAAACVQLDDVRVLHVAHIVDFSVDFEVVAGVRDLVAVDDLDGHLDAQYRVVSHCWVRKGWPRGAHEGEMAGRVESERHWPVVSFDPLPTDAFFLLSRVLWPWGT